MFLGPLSLGVFSKFVNVWNMLRFLVYITPIMFS